MPRERHPRDGRSARSSVFQEEGGRVSEYGQFSEPQRGGEWTDHRDLSGLGPERAALIRWEGEGGSVAPEATPSTSAERARRRAET